MLQSPGQEISKHPRANENTLVQKLFSQRTIRVRKRFNMRMRWSLAGAYLGHDVQLTCIRIRCNT
jgi:hypothetical protein